MNVRLTEDAAEWSAALDVFPPSVRDVGFEHALHAPHAANGEGTPLLLVAEDGADRLVVPALREPLSAVERGPLPGPLWDLQSANGYAGPLSTATGPFVDAAWRALTPVLADAGIVSVFLRLHPLLRNAAFLPSWSTVRLDRHSRYVDLAAGRAAAWDAADKRHRNVVRKAQREGLAVRWDDPADWQAFPDLYAASMDRLGAPERLRFSEAYFAALAALPAASIATTGDRAAASVFLFGPRWGHYLFSARDPAAGNHLSSLLLDAALDRAVARGLDGLHLGGGRSAAPDDALLRFKKGLGGRDVPYEVAQVITDAGRYRVLVDDWTRAAGRPPDWLTGYRQPRPVTTV